MKDLTERAKSQMAEITGLKPISVSCVLKEEQGWRIALDMLEMSRIPSSTDVVGEYDVTLDSEGNLQQFVRTRARLRCEPAAREEKA